MKTIVLCSLLASGCAVHLTGSAHATLPPQVAIAMAKPTPPKPRPCIDEVPELQRFTSLEGPDPVDGVDEEGNPISGMQFTITTDSALRFFSWVKKIQKLAEHAKDECISK